MRGKLSGSFSPCCRYRITPADAGKTPALTGFIGAGWDHPRGCGENPRRNAEDGNVSGSPPRMRGKLDMELFQAHYDRITPADAGKTY